jgi:DNA-binding PadR family transcriptional regulator
MKLPSEKERCILELLSEEPDAYGLALVAASGGQLARGTVYVTLMRMEEKGLVASREDTDPSAHAGPPRRRYRATRQGLALLEATRAFAAATAPSRLRPRGAR